MLPLSKLAPVSDQGLVKGFNGCVAGHHVKGPVATGFIVM